MASHDLTERLRHAYVASVIVQDTAFFEKIGPGEISTRASKDITAIGTAFGEKLGYLTWSIAEIIAVRSYCIAPQEVTDIFTFIVRRLLLCGFSQDRWRVVLDHTSPGCNHRVPQLGEYLRR